MGETPGAPLDAGQLHALNQPRTIEVAVDTRNIPRRVRLKGTQLRVIGISDVWRVDDGWWREEADQVQRVYYELTLENVAHLTLFHDLLRGSWHEQRA